MSMISVEYRDTVAIVKLCKSVTNALDLELVNELGAVLEKVKHESSVRGLVLGSSSDKFFSIGFDIQRMFDFPRKGFEAFFKAFNHVCLSLYTIPKPTVAAITGHAVAGGCILVLCCDYRFIAEDRKLMGLNEIKLGVPVPYLADCVLRDIVETRVAKEIMDTGAFYAPMDSSRMGLVDAVFPSGEVLERAVEKAKLVGSWPQGAFAIIKRNRTEEVEMRLLAQREKKEQSFIDCWYSDEARRLLREAIKKFSFDSSKG